MKKLFMMLFLSGLFMLTVNSSSAQTKYYVYDNAESGSFNVMLTYEDVSLETVSFSSNGQWVAFTYKEYINKESSRPEKGFTCVVTDGRGVQYLVDYRRTSNMMVVKNANNQQTWKLYPRKL